jgi:hypothetical protein
MEAASLQQLAPLPPSGDFVFRRADRLLAPPARETAMRSHPVGEKWGVPA